MNIKNILIRMGILNFKVGDKVIPNPRVFIKQYKLIEGKEYAIIQTIEGNFITIQGKDIPYRKHELSLF